MTNSPSCRLGFFSHCSFLSSSFFISFFISCLRRAEQRLIQHYQVRPASKWTRQGGKSLLALVCNTSECSHSTSWLQPLSSVAYLLLLPRHSSSKSSHWLSTGCAKVQVLFSPVVSSLTVFHKLSIDGI